MFIVALSNCSTFSVLLKLMYRWTTENFVMPMYSMSVFAGS